mgnify:CR=1 FL=1
MYTRASTLIKLDESGKNLTPLLAGHSFGAGKALYAGFDETWKWRFEVGDKYHQRYWNQLISWIMEKPFAVSDSRISIGVGGYFIEITAKHTTGAKG